MKLYSTDPFEHDRPRVVKFGIKDDHTNGFVRIFDEDGEAEARRAMKKAPVAQDCIRILFWEDQWGNRWEIESEYVEAFE